MDGSANHRISHTCKVNVIASGGEPKSLVRQRTLQPIGSLADFSGADAIAKD